MKLHFHGADYDRKSLKVSSHQQEVSGKYRGVDVTIHQHLVRKHHDNEHQMMTYRGIAYKHN
jgi:hypothetical protein